MLLWVETGGHFREQFQIQKWSWGRDIKSRFSLGELTPHQESPLALPQHSSLQIFSFHLDRWPDFSLIKDHFGLLSSLIK